SDDYYLKKAILRLIDNALKFTEKGYVTFEANMVDGCLEFSISDTGIGIPEKDLIKIFEPFVQGDGSFTRNHGGAGIGLTIVKGITQALGASLDLETRLGAGTRFSIKFEPYAVKDTGIQ
ncbi:MAG TPA: ATP-binding protein, partial [Prolixibacteraceae bacterium]|nr:ATP-binding protein [Prolixibacteraceae bacterium]